MCLIAQSLAPVWTVAQEAPLSLGILQARILEWIATTSRGSSQPRDWSRSPTLQVDSLGSEPPGKLNHTVWQEAKALLVWTLWDHLLSSQFILFFSFFMWTMCFKSLLSLLQHYFCFLVLDFWPWGLWDLGSPTIVQTHTPYMGRWSLNHWTPREVSQFILLLTLLTSLSLGNAQNATSSIMMENQAWESSCLSPRRRWLHRSEAQSWLEWRDIAIPSLFLCSNFLPWKNMKQK